VLDKDVRGDVPHCSLIMFGKDGGGHYPHVGQPALNMYLTSHSMPKGRNS